MKFSSRKTWSSTKTELKGRIMITRRQAIRTTAFATAAVAVGSSLVNAQAQTAAAPAGPFTLPPLPYTFDALEPHIDARTMEIHHDKHHAAYVANLNKAVADSPELTKKTAEQLIADLSAVPEKIRTAVRNNGGGHVNHSLFWQVMAKNGGGQPKGDLAKAIDKKFGSFNAFKDELTKSGLGQFGSGWAWLVLDGKAVKIESSLNQDSPLSQGRHALLGLDVWEHAYYLKYQNKRADYIAAWFNVINWDFVSERFEKLA
jgi:Fe-Mn family superoxide dismutase